MSRAWLFWYTQFALQCDTTHPDTGAFTRNVVSDNWTHRFGTQAGLSPKEEPWDTKKTND